MLFDTVNDRYYYYDDAEVQEEIFRNVGWCLQSLSDIADIEEGTDNKFVQNVQDNLDNIDKAYQILRDTRDIEYPTFELPSIVEVVKESPLEYLTTPDEMLQGEFLDGMSCEFIHRGVQVLEKVAIPHLHIRENFDKIDPAYYASEAIDYNYLSDMLFNVLEYFHGLFGTKSWVGRISTDTIQSIQNSICLYEDNKKALNSRYSVGQIVEESALTYEDIDVDGYFDTYQFSDYLEKFFMAEATDIVRIALSEIEKVLKL